MRKIALVANRHSTATIFGMLSSTCCALRQDQAAIDTKQAQVQAFAKKMEPTVADMMKIADRCGENEDCISKAIAEYGNQMDVREVQARKAEGQALARNGAPRYQLWKLTSQSGTYEVDESNSRQVVEMTCTHMAFGMSPRAARQVVREIDSFLKNHR